MAIPFVYTKGIVNFLIPNKEENMIKRIFIFLLISSFIFACSSFNTKNVNTTSTQINTTNIQETPSLIADATSTQPPVFILSQTQNGVTTAITWAYTDKYRLSFEIYVYGINMPSGYQLLCPIQNISITDKQGYIYGNYENGVSESGNNLSTYCVYQSDSNAFIFTYNFYHERADYQEINASVVVSLGDFEIFSESGQQTILPNFGTYTFDLVFSSIEQLTIEPNLISENSGVIATLQRVEINPSFTTANLCLQLEDNHGWYPEISILADNKSIPANAELTIWTNYDSSLDWYESFSAFRCYRFTFPAKLIENSILQTDKIDILLSNIVINYKDAMTQEECTEIRNKIQAVTPDLDFVCHIDYRGDGYGFGLEITKIPQGMSNEIAYQVVEDSFKKSISGNWLFSINLP